MEVAFGPVCGMSGISAIFPVERISLKIFVVSSRVCAKADWDVTTSTHISTKELDLMIVPP